MDLELEVELPPSIAARGREADVVVAVPDMSGRSSQTRSLTRPLSRVGAKGVESGDKGRPFHLDVCTVFSAFTIRVKRPGKPDLVESLDRIPVR